MSGFLGGLMNTAMGALGNKAGDQLGGSLGTLLQGEGLQFLISQAKNAGLEDKIHSWIGNGDNLPISTDEIRQLLSDQQVQDIVGRTGLPANIILPALSELLPAAVDHATPNGQTPAPGQTTAQANPDQQG